MLWKEKELLSRGHTEAARQARELRLSEQAMVRQREGKGAAEVEVAQQDVEVLRDRLRPPQRA